MLLLSGVFLCDLNLQHLVGMHQAAEQRVHRLTHLEVHGTVFDLQDDIVQEASVERHEIIVAGTCAIRFRVTPVLAAVVHETAPDDASAVGLHRAGEHVRSVRMVTAVGERAGTAFAVGLYQKASKLRNRGVDLCHLLFPPVYYARIERVGNLQTSQFDRSGKIQT